MRILSSMSDSPGEKLYLELAADVGDLVQGWTTLRALSLTKSYADTLNALNGPFAGLVQASLLSYSISIVARFLDPIGKGDRMTAGFEALLSIWEPQLGGQLQPGLDDARAAAAKIVRYRNKRIAHSDFAMVSGAASQALFTFSEFDDVLGRVTALMNAFERGTGRDAIPYGNSDGRYDLGELIAKIQRLLR